MIKKQKNQKIKNEDSISILDNGDLILLEKIQVGMKDVEDGKFLTLKQAEQRLSKWLKQ